MRLDRVHAAAIVFFAGMAAVVYGVWNENVGVGNDVVMVVVLVGVGILHFGAGFAARSWWVVWWPPLVVLMSIPAGVPNDPNSYEEFPIWFGMLGFLEPAGLVLIVIGVLAAKLMARRKRRPRPPQDRAFHAALH